VVKSAGAGGTKDFGDKADFLTGWVAERGMRQILLKLSRRFAARHLVPRKLGPCKIKVNLSAACPVRFFPQCLSQMRKPVGFPRKFRFRTVMI